MNITIPSNFTGNLASSTTSFLAGFSSPVYIILGILLAMLVAELLINVLGKKYGLTTQSEYEP